MSLQREEHADQRNKIRVARTTLFDRIHAEVLDEDGIRQAVADVAAVEADAAVDKARLLQRIHQLLTPEQQAQAGEMRAEHRFRLEHGHRGFGEHAGPGDASGF